MDLGVSLSIPRPLAPLWMTAPDLAGSVVVRQSPWYGEKPERVTSTIGAAVDVKDAVAGGRVRRLTRPRLRVLHVLGGVEPVAGVEPAQRVADPCRSR
jgi:hypothetical protein